MLIRLPVADVYINADHSTHGPSISRWPDLARNGNAHERNPRRDGHANGRVEGVQGGTSHVHRASLRVGLVAVEVEVEVEAMLYRCRWGIFSDALFVLLLSRAVPRSLLVDVFFFFFRRALSFRTEAWRLGGVFLFSLDITLTLALDIENTLYDAEDVAISVSVRRRCGSLGDLCALWF